VPCRYGQLLTKLLCNNDITQHKFCLIIFVKYRVGLKLCEYRSFDRDEAFVKIKKNVERIVNKH
jgi:hypothetical protein